MSEELTATCLNETEQIHDVGTNSRRLEAAPEALGLDSTLEGNKILKPLSRLPKRAGKVRDTQPRVYEQDTWSG